MAWLSSEFFTYPASPPCRAVALTLKTLEVDHEEKLVDLLKAENKRPAFVRLNPQHTVPTLTDQGFTIWESRAIMMYLCNKYCKEENQHLYPKSPESRGVVDKFLFFDMGTLNYAINEYFKPKIYQGAPPNSEMENRMKQSLDYLDGIFEKKDNQTNTDFLCGDKPTIADISVMSTITILDAMDYKYECYGDLTRYINRVKGAFPNYKECFDKGIKLQRENVKKLEKEYQRTHKK